MNLTRSAVFVGVSFASCLLPLGVLELYLRAERATADRYRYAVAAQLAALALLTLIGSDADVVAVSLA